MKYLLLVICLPAFADLDKASTEALEKTQNLLNSPDERNTFIKSDPQAQKADGKVRELSSNPATQNKVYQTTSDIFGDIAQKSNGDVDKQKEIVNKAMTDPEGFYNSLTPAQREQIHGLATTIEAENPALGAQRP